MLTREELQQYKATLSEWLPPERFGHIVDGLMEQVGGVQFFTDTRIGFGRDASVAAKLALALVPEAMRLGPDRWPDCEMRNGDLLVQYEITEADVPGRKRGDEYKEASKGSIPKFDPVEDWVARAEQAPIALQSASKAKANKRYPKSARLVIYLNIDEYGIRQQEIEASMALSTVSAKDAFVEVWVLWKNQLYLVWDHGKRGIPTALAAKQVSNETIPPTMDR
jgi:hypothetical protein